MFRLNEAVRGRLIGPKTWDRIDKIFERKNGAARDCSTAVWAVWVWFVLICVLNVCLVDIGPGMAVAGSLSEPLSCDFSGIVTESFTIPKTVF